MQIIFFIDAFFIQTFLNCKRSYTNLTAKAIFPITSSPHKFYVCVCVCVCTSLFLY